MEQFHVESLGVTFDTPESLITTFNDVVVAAREEGMEIVVLENEELGNIEVRRVSNVRAIDAEEDLAMARVALARMEPLIILAEEASEVIQAASKAARFGYGSLNPLRPEDGTNAEQLTHELRDVMAVAVVLETQGAINAEDLLDAEAIDAKLDKVAKHAKYFDTAPAVAIIDGQSENIFGIAAKAVKSADFIPF